ncbi:MAG TPA: hypothetical protein VK789_10595 [Bryobacteraceae bacterium]|nr:hypothetical protein [Bryobacteraceae bacterium]
MSSILSINAFRANGAKSKGPTNPEGKLAAAANSGESTGPIALEGKAIVCRNPTRHGLLADSLVLKGEAEERFTGMLSALRDELQPENGVQSHQLDSMAVARWRRICIWSPKRLTTLRKPPNASPPKAMTARRPSPSSPAPSPRSPTAQRTQTSQPLRNPVQPRIPARIRLPQPKAQQPKHSNFETNRT